MGKILIYISFFLSINISGIFSPLFAADSAVSKYTSQIDACRKANAEGTAKNIEEYVCPGGVLSPQQIAFQVVMSMEFNILDKEIKAILKTIYDGENKDIGKLATIIKNNFDTNYPAKYKEICDKTVKYEASLYFKEKKDSLTTDNGVQDFVFWQEGCSKLVDKKIKSFKESAWLLGESALVTSFMKDKHMYMRSLKDQYEKFLNKWTTYIGQLSVIKAKWYKKTAKTQ